MKLDVYTTTKKEVCKAAGKNTLRFVREIMGIDFEKNVIICHGTGTFTINSIWGIIPHNNFDYNVVVLLKPEKGCLRDKYFAVKIYQNDFDIELKSKTYFDWKTIPDTYNRKGDFNENRKNCDYFIIAQSKEFSLEIKTREKYERFNNSPETDKRYKICKIQKGVTKANETYIYSIKLKDTTNNKPPFEWKLYTHGNIFYAPKHYFTLDELFDNSGYFVHARREELKRQAAKIKSEKDKAKYIETDNSGRIDELKESAKKLNDYIAEKIKNTFDYEKMYSIYQKMFDFAWIYRDIELFEERTTKKEYSSIEQSDKAYMDIMNKIAKITEGIQ